MIITLPWSKHHGFFDKNGQTIILIALKHIKKRQLHTTPRTYTHSYRLKRKHYCLSILVAERPTAPNHNSANLLVLFRHERACLLALRVCILYFRVFTLAAPTVLACRGTTSGRGGSTGGNGCPCPSCPRRGRWSTCRGTSRTGRTRREPCSRAIARHTQGLTMTPFVMRAA